MEQSNNLPKDFRIAGGSIGQVRREQEEIHQETLIGERAFYRGRDLRIYDSIFTDGESPLKEAENLEIHNTLFQWKYPLWYCKNVTMDHCILYEMARAGIWYTKDLVMTDSMIDAPKNFRRCKGVELHRVNIPHAQETLWTCEDVILDHVTVDGDYFAMNSRSLTIRDMRLTGNYAFDGVKKMEIHNSQMLTKDAFWNTEDVTVYDSFVSGEYLGWNSKNLTLINCTIESLQGMCYIENLVMRNCKLLNTTLAFEYSSVDAEISSKIDSVLNPACGEIRAESIGELILEKDKIDPEKTHIICRA